MTMHLLRGTPGLNTKKPKIKMTKAKIAKYQVQWKKHNKWAKSNRLHDFILSFDDYIDYCHGKYKVQVQAAPRKLYQQPESPHKSSKQYPSVSNGMSGNTFKKEPQRYTGTLVKGIAQMHKSNAVPVIDKQSAIDIANMRRK